MQRVPRNTLDYPEYEAFINHINTNFGTVSVTFPFRRGSTVGQHLSLREDDGNQKEGQEGPS